jgi:BirA family biotin operon repressor/biotin-[acetyl-CoA-carboxylase] ligase
LIKEKPKKIGGVITNIAKNTVICGIGLNTKFAPSSEFESLDIEIKNDKILISFFSNLQTQTWEHVINEYKAEFEKYKKIFAISGELLSDGSLSNNKKRIYSKR